MSGIERYSVKAELRTFPSHPTHELWKKDNHADVGNQEFEDTVRVAGIERLFGNTKIV
jgi:hypothetical protein